VQLRRVYEAWGDSKLQARASSYEQPGLGRSELFWRSAVNQALSDVEHTNR